MNKNTGWERREGMGNATYYIYLGNWQYSIKRVHMTNGAWKYRIDGSERKYFDTLAEAKTEVLGLINR
jgi:hypothetical protein